MVMLFHHAGASEARAILVYIATPWGQQSSLANPGRCVVCHLPQQTGSAMLVATKHEVPLRVHASLRAPHGIGSPGPK